MTIGHSLQLVKELKIIKTTQNYGIYGGVITI